jgi:hypothetical protein
MNKISWKYRCYVCQRPIQCGKPTILFATDKPMMLGIGHSTCSYRRNNYERFQMCPPHYLSSEQISFLVHFFHRLYALPGGQEPDRELRWCLGSLLRNYPASLSNAMESLRFFLDEHKRWSPEWLYNGDLETDYLRLLGQIQREAREMPVELEIDFRV